MDETEGIRPPGDANYDLVTLGQEAVPFDCTPDSL